MITTTMETSSFPGAFHLYRYVPIILTGNFQENYYWLIFLLMKLRFNKVIMHYNQMCFCLWKRVPSWSVKPGSLTPWLPHFSLYLMA